MFERPHLQALTKKMEEPRRFIQVVMGPRQIGKITLLRQLIDKIKIDYHFASADAVAATNSAWLEQQWETGRLKMDHLQAEDFLLVIDEIQKIDNWSETAKLLWDTDTLHKKNLI